MTEQTTKEQLKVYGFHLTESDSRLLTELSKEKGVTRSVFIRKLINDGVVEVQRFEENPVTYYDHPNHDTETSDSNPVS